MAISVQMIDGDSGDYVVPEVSDSEVASVVSQASKAEWSSSLDKAKEALNGYLSNKYGVSLAFFGDHNHAGHYWNLSRNDGSLRKGAVLLHFDAHDDMQTPPGAPPPAEDAAAYKEYIDRVSIAAFIVPAVVSGTVDEIYWILPDWAGEIGTKNWEAYWQGFRCFGMQNPIEAAKASEISLVGMYGAGEDLVYYAGEEIRNGEKSIYFSRTPPPEDARFAGPVRRVTLHKMYRDELPDFASETRDLIVDVDLDWFNPTGFDTQCDINPELPPRQAVANVAVLVQALADKNIAPKSITVATSPDYTYSDEADDLATRLADRLIRSGIVKNPRLIIGEPSYSANEFLMARALFNFVFDNMKNDPRFAENGVDVGVRDFNGQTVILETWSVDEHGHEGHTPNERLGSNRTTPSDYCWERSHDSIKRGDYSKFIDVCGKYGLTGLKEALLNLQVLQAKGKTEKEIKASYLRVLSLLKSIIEQY